MVTYNNCDENTLNKGNCFKGCDCIILDNIDKIDNISNFVDVFNTKYVDGLIECELLDRYPFIIVTTNTTSIIEKYHRFEKYIFFNPNMDINGLSSYFALVNVL